jgi:alpha-galactosidase
MSLWAIFAAPLLAGNDVRTMSADTRSILMNKDIIAIDQDPLGRQGQLALRRGDVDYWKRQLSNDGVAIAAVNRVNKPVFVTIPWKELGIDAPVGFKDVWNEVLARAGSDSEFTIPPHGVVLLRTQSMR